MPWRHPLVREALLCAALATAAAALLAWLAPPGGDLAAHEYQRALYLARGFTLWNNFWYAGRYTFVGYSALYYPLAALLGIRLLAVVTVALAAVAFSLLLAREWGRDVRWASRSFALVWAGVLVTGELPFALGAALALFVLVALREGRRWTGAALTLLVLSASPVAFVLLAVVLLAVALARRTELRGMAVPVAGVAVAGAAELVLLRLFPGGGRLGFPLSQAIAAAVFCLGGVVLTFRVERARVLTWVFGIYLAALVVTYAIPSGLGHDIVRLRFLGLPLGVLVASLRRWRPLPLALLGLALAAAWNITPLASGWARSDGDGSRSASVWQAPVAYLHAHLQPGYRVEAVDTTAHWPALYLAEAAIPLARGWFRQDDFPLNTLLYRQPLEPRAYVRWLRELGVAYVVLTDAPTDYSSKSEAAIVRDGRAGLRRVFSAPHVSIYAVPRPQPIVTGPGSARVLSLREASLAVRLSQAGTYDVAVHWSPYWQASSGCLSRAPDGLLLLHAPAAGTTRLSFDVTASRLWRAFVGDQSTCRTSSSSGLRLARADHSAALRLSTWRGRAG